LPRARHRIGDAGFDQASWKFMDCAASSVRWHARTIDPESADWLAALEGAAPARDAALVRLHALLLRVARAEAARRAPAIGLAGPELDDSTQQAADDALVAIVAKLGEFRGDSRFTTWAYKFAVLEVAGKLTRHAWRKTAPSRLEEDWTLLPDRFGFGPAEAAEWAEMFALLRRAVDEDLSPRQRRIFVAIVLQGVPLDVLMQELGSNRNAVYKSLFDARRKLRARLVANGYMDDLARRA
jgi:RNA polymerase sigma-70 factor, ECF subfamily